MIEILGYIFIILLFLIIIFFLGRTALILITMLTEVPFLPSNNAYKEAIKYLEIKNGDKVIDIGCGDGRVMLYAAKQYPNAEFVGIDRNLLLIAYAKLIKFFSGVKNVKFKRVNAHRFDISKFNKIYLYLLPNIVEELLLEKAHELQKDSTIISFHYNFSKKFRDIHNTTHYPVKYKHKQENIYKWVNK
jgi:16S rRNA A1518/A1519 N6-dimethyltransferase RsmA/KsgA/DIM1 with predicted DNA glycosylase/AP lyase activity